VLERCGNLIGSILIDTIAIEISDDDAVDFGCVVQSIGFDVEGGTKAIAFRHGGGNDKFTGDASEYG
jgi:hypothetical protein